LGFENLAVTLVCDQNPEYPRGHPVSFEVKNEAKRKTKRYKSRMVPRTKKAATITVCHPARNAVEMRDLSATLSDLRS